MKRPTVLILCMTFCFFIAAAAWPADKKPEEKTIADYTKKSLSALPILMYDTDIGVGYGAKAKFVNYLKKRESFDFIVFNSSKGERWYVFTFSIPDFEIRQGKRYALSFDLKAEYDKYIRFYYYGRGPHSPEADKTEFQYAKTQVQLTLGRGITPHFVMELSYFIKHIKYFNIIETPDEGPPPPPALVNELKAVGNQFSPYLSLVLRYDTSNSQIHPTRGTRILFQNDVAVEFLGNKKAQYYRLTLDFRKYFLIFGKKDVFAFRALFQNIFGKEANIPLFELPVLGGGAIFDAMRGYKLNRFVDRGKVLVNVEYRFPIFWRFGGNVFVDAGSVFPRVSFNEMKLAIDAGWGLRFYMKDFVVRFDMGFSKEGMGIYFNFGHIF